jgi:hypothetical protein
LCCSFFLLLFWRSSSFLFHPHLLNTGKRARTYNGQKNASRRRNGSGPSILTVSLWFVKRLIGVTSLILTRRSILCLPIWP